MLRFSSKFIAIKFQTNNFNFCQSPLVFLRQLVKVTIHTRIIENSWESSWCNYLQLTNRSLCLGDSEALFCFFFLTLTYLCASFWHLSEVVPDLWCNLTNNLPVKWCRSEMEGGGGWGGMQWQVEQHESGKAERWKGWRKKKKYHEMGKQGVETEGKKNISSNVRENRVECSLPVNHDKLHSYWRKGRDWVKDGNIVKNNPFYGSLLHFFFATSFWLNIF